MTRKQGDQEGHGLNHLVVGGFRATDSEMKIPTTSLELEKPEFRYDSYIHESFPIAPGSPITIFYSKDSSSSKNVNPPF